MTAALVVLGLIVVAAILAGGCLIWFCRDHSEEEDRPAHVEGGGLVGDPGPRVEDNFRTWRAW